MTEAGKQTLAAIESKAPVIYQAALQSGPFAGYADFLMLDQASRYQVWDTKLARSPKPFYAIQLCCYADMLADMTGAPPSDRFGIILGTKERVNSGWKISSISIGASGNRSCSCRTGSPARLEDRPEPLPRADHGRWTSHAESFFDERDHFVQVASITVGQIKKLRKPASRR